MMYSEFVKGTGCKLNNYNYNVFCNLESIYMSTNMTKDEVYEYGKKLVDNGHTLGCVELSCEAKELIKIVKSHMKYLEKQISLYELCLCDTGEWDNDPYLSQISSFKNNIKTCRRFIKFFSIFL